MQKDDELLNSLDDEFVPKQLGLFGMDKDDSAIELPPDYQPMENIKVVDVSGNVYDIIDDEFTKLGKYYSEQALLPDSIHLDGGVNAFKGLPEVFNVAPTIAGADIIKIRTLTGKARKQADRALRSAAAEFLKNASAEFFYVPGNTASSKNSKDIGFYLKRSEKTGKMERIHVLVDSALTKKYKRDTKGYWLENKADFLNQTRNLPIPFHLEFTFIRDSLRAFDFINASQVICDLMTEHGYYADDDTVHLVPVFNPVVFYSAELAGVLIRVIK